jgi:O-methyltransferase
VKQLLRKAVRRIVPVSLVKKVCERFVRGGPVSCMSPANLYAFLDALYQKRDVDGPVVEVGCFAGYTAAIAYTFLVGIQKLKDYYCIDTFRGFVSDHVQTDMKLGFQEELRTAFSENSIEAVKSRLYGWGVSKRLHLIEGDICSLDDSLIPEGISVCLLDVDLRDPTYGGLEKIYAKLSPNGVILVDDCKKGTTWIGANVGYTDFMRDRGLTPRYFLGMGVLEKSELAENALNWRCSDRQNVVADFYSREFQT